MSGDARAPSRFGHYVIAGAVNTALSYGLYLLLLHWLDYRGAYTGAYAVAIVTQYLLHARYVFVLPLSWRGLLGYPPIHLALYGIGVFLLYVLVDVLGVPVRVAPLVVIVFNIPLGFVLTRAWLGRAARAGSDGAAAASGDAPAASASALSLDKVLAVLLTGVTLAFALSAVTFILAFGWREPMFDQLRQYLPLLEQPFPTGVLTLENGHRPIIPNLLRVADLALGGNQVLLLVAGLLFALATAGITAWTVWRDPRLPTSTRAAATLLCCISVLWLANARMLLHGNESSQVYLVALAVVLGGWLTWRAASGASIAAAFGATLCCVVATFSFGSGIAAFPAMIVLALAMRAQWRVFAVLGAGMGLALLLYLAALPGDDGVRNTIVLKPVANAALTARWLAGPWVNAWLGLFDPPAGFWLHDTVARIGIGGALVRTSHALADSLGAEAVNGALALSIGAAGLLALVGLLLRKYLRRESWTAMSAIALTLALFGAATSALVSLARMDYFLAYPTQIFAERYGVWPCLFWLGLALLAIDALAPVRRIGVAIAIAGFAALVALVAWPAHSAWRGWGVTVDQRAEALAASLRLGVYDPDVLPAEGEAPAAKLRRVVDLLRERNIAFFLEPSWHWVGGPLPVALESPANDAAHMLAGRRFDDSATPRSVIAFSGALLDPRARDQYGALLIVDASQRVVGLAQWIGDPSHPSDALLSIRRRSGFVGYLLPGDTCGVYTLAATRADGTGAVALSRMDTCDASEQESDPR